MQLEHTHNVRIISTNIISPLGDTTEENYRAVRAGKSACLPHEAGERGVPFDFCAALFQRACSFEDLAIRSAKDAINKAKGIALDRTLYILSTTKGDADAMPGDSAKRIAVALGIKSAPIVVCNACISGAAAMVLAMRMLKTETYDYVVVTGADVQTCFTLAGFESLKALSDEPCRPFDAERRGLNLGEAAATVVMTREDSGDTTRRWRMLNGAITNDAYHTSTPHPKGVGCMKAINQVLQGYDKERLATVSVHGTATMYNDQMESKAIEGTALSNVPLSALKGYFGHTMGAAGLLEMILTARALDDGWILPTKGYQEVGVSGKVKISSNEVRTEKSDFLKIISGFGGCNAALLLSKEITSNKQNVGCLDIRTLRKTRITHDSIEIDGTCIATIVKGKAMLTEVYKDRVGQYPRFYKMDTLSKLAFLAAELLLKDISGEDTAVVLFNSTSSMVTDQHFRETMYQEEGFFPSPSLFVYTLPNITTGEIALRHGLHNETSFYILSERNDVLMRKIITATLADGCAQKMLTGWIDCRSDDDFECEMSLLELAK